MSYVQTLESHLIYSHHTNIWSGGGGAMRAVSLGGGADRQFGSRAVHPIKQDKQRVDIFIIDGFMACLKWYTDAQLEGYGDPTTNSRDMIECVVRET
jgi:hypothetical protein